MDHRNQEASPHRDPVEIEREIAVTRESIDSTVEELGDRLTPSQLVDDAKEFVKEKAMRGANTAWARVNENAMPLALIGSGVIWMMRSGDRSGNGFAARHPARSYRGTQPFGSTQREGITDRMRDAASDVTERASEKASELTESARDAGHELRENMRSRFESMREEQPLLLGLASLALGALIGGLLPSTRREEELLGEARDQVVQAAAETVREKSDQARESIEETKQREEGGRGGDGAARSHPQGQGRHGRQG